MKDKKPSCLLSGLRPMGLRSQLILTYTVLIVVGFGGLTWLAGEQISRGAQEDFVAAQQAQSELLARSLVENVEHFQRGEESEQILKERLQTFAEQLQGSLILLDSGGRVLLDSQGESVAGEQWQTSEVNTALSNGSAHSIRAAPDGQINIYAAAPLRDDGQLLGVILAVRPLSAAEAVVRQRWGVLAIGVLLLGMLAIAASSMLATSLTRPLEAMRSAALQLAAGDLKQQLPSGRRDEIGAVSIAFNYMAEQVRTMIEEQRAFAANASHELRTPLTTIRLRSEALRVETLDQEVARQYVAEIDDEATRLSGLVEDLILLARLDAGRAVRGSDEIDVARVVRGLLREFESSPEAQDITLKLVVLSDLPTLTASLNHLRVLLRNLISNALAYTPAGGSVTCTLQVEDSHLVIRVIDTGQGITAEDLPHVTERFFRVDKAHTRAVKGTGLGLTLVQSIVNCYGGRLEITSLGLDKGTTAFVWFPLDSSSQAETQWS